MIIERSSDGEAGDSSVSKVDRRHLRQHASFQDDDLDNSQSSETSSSATSNMTLSEASALDRSGFTASLQKLDKAGLLMCSNKEVREQSQLTEDLSVLKECPGSESEARETPRTMAATLDLETTFKSDNHKNNQ